MNTWLIDPHDALIFGDGRPNTAAAGVTNRSRLLPPPTALAGAVRGVSGKDARGRFGGGRAPRELGDFARALEQQAVHGPLVAVLGAEGQVVDYLLPGPGDALEVEVLGAANGARSVVQRRPVRWPEGALGAQPALAPIAPPADCEGKPWHDARPLWRWSSELLPWLSEARPAARNLGPAGWGAPAPEAERRTHVALDPSTGTAAMGALYGSEGRRWVLRNPDEMGFVDLCISARVAGELREQAHPLGGERRMARWRRSDADWPACPSAIRDAILRHGAARLLLATPAWLRAGALPDLAAPFGLSGARLVGAANARPEVISGWAMRAPAGPGPKPTRRLVPAGAVYFLDLRAVDAAARERWIEATWLQPVSEDPQSCLDGLGLALLGAWDGRVDDL